MFHFTRQRRFRVHKSFEREEKIPVREKKNENNRKTEKKKFKSVDVSPHNSVLFSERAQKDRRHGWETSVTAFWFRGMRFHQRESYPLCGTLSPLLPRQLEPSRNYPTPSPPQPLPTNERRFFLICSFHVFVRLSVCVWVRVLFPLPHILSCETPHTQTHTHTRITVMWILLTFPYPEKGVDEIGWTSCVRTVAATKDIRRVYDDCVCWDCFLNVKFLRVFCVSSECVCVCVWKYKCMEERRTAVTTVTAI